MHVKELILGLHSLAGCELRAGVDGWLHSVWNMAPKILLFLKNVPVVHAVHADVASLLVSLLLVHLIGIAEVNHLLVLLLMAVVIGREGLSDWLVVIEDGCVFVEEVDFPRDEWSLKCVHFEFKIYYSN